MMFDDAGWVSPFDGMGLDEAELFLPRQASCGDLLGLLDDHIDRLWQRLPAQSQRRLGVIAVSTGSGVEPDRHTELLGAMGLIAEAEGTLEDETEFCETYLTVPWVCEAVAEWERARLPDREERQERPERQERLEGMSPAKKQARRREQTKLAVRKYRDKQRAAESEQDRTERERRAESLSATLAQRAIAIDGEGMSLPDGSHVYRYMAACRSDGTLIRELRNEAGIRTPEAIEFVSGLPKRDEDGEAYLGVFGYGLGYDMTKWLERVKNKPLYDLFHSDDMKPKIKVRNCKLLLIGKCLEIVDTKALAGEKRTKVWDILKGFQSTFVKAIKAWKVGTPEDWARLSEMKAKRGNFIDSDWSENGEVERYCKDECRLLAELVETYVRAHVEAGIDLRGKFHGAGSTSDAFLMMMKALDKKCTRETDCPDLDSYMQTKSAFSRGFFGGRAEVSRLGVIKGPFWTVDIASAYPHVLFELPCVRHGKWRKVAGRGLKRALRAAKVACVHYRLPFDPAHEGGDDVVGESQKRLTVAETAGMEAAEYREAREKAAARTKKRKAAKKKAEAAGIDSNPDDELTELQRTAHGRAMRMGVLADVATLPWGPLPYRTDKGSIVFPAAHPGGWAWLPEFRAAEAEFPKLVAMEAWVLRGSCKCERPYRDIGKYYMLRIEWDAASGEKDGTGKGKVLKLGYNGCYGKTAQVIGKNPKYSCRVVAGHITGSTRGRLYEAIASAKDPWSVFYAATDGLIATEPLDPPNPPENETTPKTKKWLGVWEVSEPVNEDAFVVQPGFWFSLAPLGKARTRGTPLEIIYAYRPQILEQWRADPTRKPRGLPKASTFHGAKSSVRPPTKDDPKYRRAAVYGRWTEEHRRINYVVSPKRSMLVDQGDESYRLMTWRLRREQPESHEYKKDPTFKHFDDMNDEQPDFVEPLVRGVGEVESVGVGAEGAE